MIRDFEKRDKSKRLVLRFSVLLLFLLSAVLTLLVRVRQITVIGNTHYSEEEIEARIFPDYWDRNSLYCYLKDRFRPHPAVPFVERYQLSWQSPFQLKLVLYEKSVVGYVDYMSSRLYFDKDGIIVESTGEELEGIPRVEGLEFGHIVLYRPLPVRSKKIFTDILNLTSALQQYQLSCDSIRYDQLQQATLMMGDIEVSLGDSANMEMKISLLHDILPKLEGMKGNLDLSVYTDSNPGQRYIFHKK